MAKLKPLKPTLREKKRYVAFEVLAKHKIAAGVMQKAVENAMMGFVGTKGLAQAGMIFVKDSYKENKGIVRVAHSSADDLKNALTLITHVDNEEVIVRSLITSGMIKKAKAYVS